MDLCQEYFWANLYIIEFLPVNWVTGAENLINFFTMLSPLNLTADKKISERIISMQWGGGGSKNIDIKWNSHLKGRKEGETKAVGPSAAADLRYTV